MRKAPKVFPLKIINEKNKPPETRIGRREQTKTRPMSVERKEGRKRRSGSRLIKFLLTESVKKQLIEINLYCSFKPTLFRGVCFNLIYKPVDLHHQELTGDLLGFFLLNEIKMDISIWSLMRLRLLEVRYKSLSVLAHCVSADNVF